MNAFVDIPFLLYSGHLENVNQINYIIEPFIQYKFKPKNAVLYSVQNIFISKREKGNEILERKSFEKAEPIWKNSVKKIQTNYIYNNDTYINKCYRIFDQYRCLPAPVVLSMGKQTSNHRCSIEHLTALDVCLASLACCRSVGLAKP